LNYRYGLWNRYGERKTKRRNYLCSPDDLDPERVGEARRELSCVLRSVSSVSVSRLRVGGGLPLPLRGCCGGLVGLMVAISYVGRFSLMGVRAGVRTAVLYDGVLISASISYSACG